jgi:hypothetical protein
MFLLAEKNWHGTNVKFGSNIRFEVLMTVKMMMIWVMTPRRLVGRYQRFGETYCQLNPEDGDSMFLRNGIYL